MQPFRGTRPLLQGNAISCRSGLVPRKGRKAAPVFCSALHRSAGFASNAGSYGLRNHAPRSLGQPKQKRPRPCDRGRFHFSLNSISSWLSWQRGYARLRRGSSCADGSTSASLRTARRPG
ncbi:hypothetical protein E3U47_10590 [Pseudomonas sp. RIT623]|nr:hypothetical protein E3U47_10590 [Pseudomonas sp. RIT623]